MEILRFIKEKPQTVADAGLGTLVAGTIVAVLLAISRDRQPPQPVVEVAPTPLPVVTVKTTISRELHSYRYSYFMSRREVVPTDICPNGSIVVNITNKGGDPWNLNIVPRLEQGPLSIYARETLPNGEYNSVDIATCGDPKKTAFEIDSTIVIQN